MYRVEVVYFTRLADYTPVVQVVSTKKYYIVEDDQVYQEFDHFYVEEYNLIREYHPADYAALA